MPRIVSLVALSLGLGLLLGGGGCKPEGVGDPCMPELEYDTTFTGFNDGEVYVESKSFQCQTRVCLVNHFQGRKSCPYGTSAGGQCLTPTGDAVTGEVKPQCEQRQADKTVYCSCRCANVNGKTDDGAVYCACPDGFECSPLVTAIGSADTGLSGSYCIRSGTAYAASTQGGGCTPECSSSQKNCGEAHVQ